MGNVIKKINEREIKLAVSPNSIRFYPKFKTVVYQCSDSETTAEAKVEINEEFNENSMISLQELRTDHGLTEWVTPKFYQGNSQVLVSFGASNEEFQDFKETIEVIRDTDDIEDLVPQFTFNEEGKVDQNISRKESLERKSSISSCSSFHKFSPKVLKYEEVGRSKNVLSQKLIEMGVCSLDE